ncbi:hypothetical protein ACFYKT_06955 [Cytobacillus sp. FJAT-53684]|uniref:Uncharacterized protein n=1 Tax=Cytobacillus mangrovibacter TaxID=3299024 RepID=A0ABW6JW37_9BACI
MQLNLRKINFNCDIIAEIRTFTGEIMITKFETRYFFIKSLMDEKFIRWNTVEGILSEDILDDYDIISELMAQDVRDKFGEEYDVWEISKDDFDERIKPDTE